MDPPFSPHKTFTDPGAVGGVPRVIKSTPVPRRGAPLPGTRPMLCPRDEHLFEMEGAHPPEAVKPPLTATVMGAIAVAAALGNNVLAWRFMQSDHPLSRHEAWLFFPGIALVLLLWLFSRVLSNGSSRLGFLALVVLSIGPLVPGFIHRLLMLQNP